MKKLTVCYLCDYGVGDNGDALAFVEPLQQLVLLSKGRLETTICYDCFRKNYKHLVRNLVMLGRKLKTQFDITQIE